MKIAYCGDNCEFCPRYVATLSNSKEKLKEAALLMRKVGLSYNLENPENMMCHGCQDKEKCENNVRECCVEKKIENCGQCDNYPCSAIKKVFARTEAKEKEFKKILTKNEFKIFQKAFFSKRENLNKI